MTNENFNIIYHCNDSDSRFKRSQFKVEKNGELTIISIKLQKRKMNNSEP